MGGPHVVVVGGGLAGLSVSTTLSRAAGRTGLRVTLVEPKDFVEVRWAAVRGLFDPATAEAATIPIDHVLRAHPAVTHVRAKVVALAAAAARLDDGTELPFSACLLATGCEPAHSLLGSATVDMADRRAQLAAEGRRVRAAQSVLVVGGGPLGAELAGDVAHAARARVTLVHDGKQLAPPLGRRAAARLQEQLESLGIDVITGERAEEAEEGVWVVESTGRPLNGEVVVRATGVAPAPVGAGKLVHGLKGGADADERGWVRADEHGRVTGSVFAMGDCTVGELKSGVCALGNRKAMAHNLRVVAEAVMAGKRIAEVERSLRTLGKPSVSTMAVSAGPGQGVVQTRLFTDTALLPRLRYRTSLSISKARAELGL